LLKASLIDDGALPHEGSVLVDVGLVTDEYALFVPEEVPCVEDSMFWSLFVGVTTTLPWPHFFCSGLVEELADEELIELGNE